MGTSFNEELLERVRKRAEGRTVREVRIGLSFTAVQLDDGACGVAYTFRDDAGGNCSVLEQAGSISGRPAAEVAGWVLALDAITAGVGVATCNALIEAPAAAVEADMRDTVRVGPGDVVGMVGYFGPMVEELRARASVLHIFERAPRDEEGVLPDWASPVLLPECDVAIVSGTTVINRTLEGLLACATKAREVVVVGPSTPMVPDLFEKRGVTLLSGIQVTDAQRMLRVVSEGGGTSLFWSAVRRLSVRIKP